MNSRILIATLAAALLAGSARAEDKPAPTRMESAMTFFRHLKESLAQSAVQGQRKKNRVGTVAAVRGADQSSAQLGDPNQTVLKGDARSKKEKMAMAEDADFAKAVDLIVDGKNNEGVAALESFKAKHPKSHNLDKVQQAIEQAKAMPAASAAPAAADEAPKADAPKTDGKN